MFVFHLLAVFPWAIAAYQVELTLKADHSFMFAIVHDNYDVPLFMGAVKKL